MNTNQERLFSVQEALSAASQATARPSKKETSSFRIEEELRKEVQEICKIHGTDMSTFLRMCCLSLVNEYRS